MDSILYIFSRFGIFTIAFLLISIVIARLTIPASTGLLKILQDRSKHKHFRIIFFMTGACLGTVTGLIIGYDIIISALSGLVCGVLYFGLILSVINRLHDYIQEDEE